MTLPQNIGDWIVIDSGVKTGEEHMAIDRFALDLLVKNPNTRPILRFFQWAQPTVTYGYLLDENQVAAWAKSYGPVPIVKRPSGGGAVHHKETDLSLSLLWPRENSTLSDTPRTCYAEIHDALKNALLQLNDRHPGMPFGRDPGFELYTPGSRPNTCRDDDSARFSVCFQEPVCNDVMIGEKKIIGGALRITKHAILYQGHIEWNKKVSLAELKIALVRALEAVFTQNKELVASQ